ncbi:MAG: hypothetical protein M1837_005256 [Sclerophora amabilis]|nr:MAG: hypothetical protein M1837_005256 [Sclerophora amabilis]
MKLVPFVQSKNLPSPNIFAWYTLIGTAGTACGTIICGWITQTLRSLDGWTDTQAYRVVFVVYALLGIVKLFVSLMLSDKCEVLVEKHERQDEVELGNVEAETLLDEEGPREESKPAPNPRAAVNEKAKKSFWPHINPESRSILLKLCLLFAIDSTASGLVPSSWITSFFNRKFSLAEGKLGTIFFATNIVSAASNLVASSMAKRIGLIKTMVFTHLPSAICLTLIPLPSVLGLAITLLILRSSTQSMDQAPRQAFLAAAVLPSERTAVMGVVNVVKTLSQSAGPVVTGWLAGSGKFWIVFVVAGAMKATYDLSMLKLFLGYKTQESRLLERQERESTDSDANA